MNLGQVTPTPATPAAPAPGIFGKITSGLDSVSKMVGAVGAAVSGQTPKVVLQPTPTGVVHEKDYTPYIAIGGVVLAGAGILGYMIWKKRRGTGLAVARNPRRHRRRNSLFRIKYKGRLTTWDNLAKALGKQRAIEVWGAAVKYHGRKKLKSFKRQLAGYRQRHNAPRLGSGGRMRSFVSKCVAGARRRGFHPHKYRTIDEFCKATGAKVGRRKYGKGRFQALAAAGRRRGRKIIRVGRFVHARRAAANPGPKRGSYKRLLVPMRYRSKAYPVYKKAVRRRRRRN
jgi:hypothetical protein